MLSHLRVMHFPGLSPVYTLVMHTCPTLCDPMDCSSPGSSVHGILRQEYWSGLPCPPPGDLPNPGTEPVSCRSYISRQVLYRCTTWEDLHTFMVIIFFSCLFLFLLVFYYKSQWRTQKGRVPSIESLPKCKWSGLISLLYRTLNK